MRLLLIEDEEAIAEPLKQSFKEHGFIVDIAPDGEIGLNMTKDHHYDAIVLDYVLPKMNGREVCQEIRKREIQTPILMLSVKSSTEVKTDVLNIGADDYLSKPFHFEELLARINALLRRPPQLKEEELCLSNITINTANQHVLRGSNAIDLTKREFDLLEFLMRNPNRVCTRQEITDHVWSTDVDPFSNTIEVHIASLRRKIDPDHKLIHTISGRGYSFNV